MKGILFDLQKNQSELIGVNTHHDEKFVLFTHDKVISKEIFLKEEFDINKLIKTIDFLKQKKTIKNLYDIGANIGVICIPAVKRNLVKKAIAIGAVTITIRDR